MEGQPAIRVLWVEDDEDDYILIRASLSAIEGTTYDLTWVTTYDAALEAMLRNQHDICLIDYRLGARNGLGLLREAVALGCEVPMILLTGLGDRALDLEAMQAGAADYLDKGQIGASSLERAIRYAIERHKLQSALRDLSLRDDLTDLYNRRGFFTLAGQYVKLAHRQGQTFLVMFTDLDRLKWINDVFGHQQGSQALIDTANVLKATFRTTDIIARLGGDEFVVLVANSADDNIDTIVGRLQENLHCHNAQKHRHYDLSLSIGFAHFDPESGHAIEEAIARADQAMYEHKRSKGASRGA